MAGYGDDNGSDPEPDPDYHADRRHRAACVLMFWWRRVA